MDTVSYDDLVALPYLNASDAHRIIKWRSSNQKIEFDDLQNIVTNYMRSSAYSVGISDLIANKATSDAIVDKITQKKQDVVDLLHQTQLGVS